ncbi:hypothetical protein CGH11_12995 [Vibrio parahaemolyticus]|uniref:ASCH domain-containing protein n=1 Tax=Vibrio parahaemolyticus TaxID=670 RepID=UPI001120339E|nr:ASCH domain-containing protein [Vibrio parahaemolyticus]TOP71767.1 hypothetical protein CGH11_12995 [Vibrio parahaemolyticus]
MKQMPMIFNTEMVNAILDGRKTVTRRPVKYYRPVQWKLSIINGKVVESLRGGEPLPTGIQLPCFVGDLIYVRETWREFKHSDECGCSDYCSCPATGTILYFASHDDGESKWKPSIHMPKAASRITLKVTDVRIERVQEITEEQAVLEGMPTDEECQRKAVESGLSWYQKPVTWFKNLWDGLYSNWSDNPYVWVIEFEVVNKNVSEVAEGLKQQESAA